MVFAHVHLANMVNRTPPERASIADLSTTIVPHLVVKLRCTYLIMHHIFIIKVVRVILAPIYIPTGTTHRSGLEGEHQNGFTPGSQVTGHVQIVVRVYERHNGRLTRRALRGGPNGWVVREVHVHNPMRLVGKVTQMVLALVLHSILIPRCSLKEPSLPIRSNIQ